MSKFVIFVHASGESEAGKMPPVQEFIDMGAFNNELRDAGVLVAVDGLVNSTKGARVTFSDGEPQVKNGPFQVENLVSGFWILKLDSFEEALAWAKKVPFKSGSVEVRQIASLEDFGTEFNEELKAKKEELAQQSRGT